MPSVEDITAFVSEHATLAGPLIFLVCFGELFAVISLFVRHCHCRRLWSARPEWNAKFLAIAARCYFRRHPG